MSNLNLITKKEIQETGSASDEYKGFTVFVRMVRHGYKFSIGMLLESDSDACHWICQAQTANTIQEVKSVAKKTINDFSYSAQQLIDLNNYIEISNHCLISDDLKSVESFINDELNRQKKIEIRRMTKPVYKVLMSAYRYAKSIIITAMEISPHNHRELAKRLKYINEQFEINHLKPQGMDIYHPDSCHAWVINRVMDKMNLSAQRAMELASKFWADPREKTDYLLISQNKHDKNINFYKNVLKGRVK